MGFGILSSTFTYIPRYLPSKPQKAPRNVATSTIRDTIYIAYDALIDGADGGSPILAYNIYMDDGADGEFTNVGQLLDLAWNTS